MSGYLIALVRQLDPSRLGEYGEKAPDLIAAYGGRYLVQGGEIDPVEFDDSIGGIVVVEFPSLSVARRFYHSEEYQRLSAIRRSAADVDMLLVDGLRR
jgi:uncharacterized protein (DUF1330 family)